MTKRMWSLRRTSAMLVSTPAIAMWAVLMLTSLSQAQTFRVLYAFGAGPDAGFSTAALIRDAAGNLYGTTLFNGAFGNGAVFQVDPSGNETVLYSFTGGPDGGLPFAGLVRDGEGNLYGTTTQGGDLSCSMPIGCGTVFKLDPSGNQTVLHSFGVGSDGQFPYGGLLRDRAGNLFGTTVNGGSSANLGTLYEVSVSGREKVLYRFKGKSDGAFPFGNLVLDGMGGLYGATTQFGTTGGGTIFRRNRSGQVVVLASLEPATGESPLGGLARDSAGNLYGAATYVGANGAGSVFKIDPSGTQSVLYSFTNRTDGGTPNAGLVRDAAGNLYGTALTGGSADGTNGFGTVFEVDTAGHFSVLHTFSGGRNGGLPYGGLTIDAMGNLYGTAAVGGANGNGVVFKIVK